MSLNMLLSGIFTSPPSAIVMNRIILWSAIPLLTTRVSGVWTLILSYTSCVFNAIQLEITKFIFRTASKSHMEIVLSPTRA